MVQYRKQAKKGGCQSPRAALKADIDNISENIVFNK